MYRRLGGRLSDMETTLVIQYKREYRPSDIGKVGWSVCEPKN
jgi:hypothetical protein